MFHGTSSGHLVFLKQRNILALYGWANNHGNNNEMEEKLNKEEQGAPHFETNINQIKSF